MHHLVIALMLRACSRWHLSRVRPQRNPATVTPALQTLIDIFSKQERQALVPAPPRKNNQCRSFLVHCTRCSRERAYRHTILPRAFFGKYSSFVVLPSTAIPAMSSPSGETVTTLTSDFLKGGTTERFAVIILNWNLPLVTPLLLQKGDCIDVHLWKLLHSYIISDEKTITGV